MRIDEIVLDFPIDKKKVTRQGKVRKSGVVGKTSDGRLVYTDELTGLPMVDNKYGVPFYLDKTDDGVYELPDHFDDDYQQQPEWLVVDQDAKIAHSTHSSYEDAELAVRKLEKWHHEDVKIIQIQS